VRRGVRQYASRRTSVECERRRQFPVCLDLRFQIGDLLLGVGDGIAAGDEAARRRVLVGNRDQCARELRRVAGLLPVLGFPILDQRPAAVLSRFIVLER
jgi:hypothetical protein